MYILPNTSTGVFKPFDELTRASFRHATREAGISMSSSDEEQIMDAYNALSPFPDALPGLDLLSQTPSAAACIFSNGTTDMVTSSAQAAKIGLTRAVTVEAVGVYKPDVRTYEHLVKEAQRESSRSKEEVWVVSSNPFDVLGAVSAGLRSCWVDRTGKGWVDGLGEAVGLEPSLVVGGVDEAVRAILGTGRGKEEKGQGS